MKQQIMALLVLSTFSIGCEKEQVTKVTTDVEPTKNQPTLCISSDGVTMLCDEIEAYERELSANFDREKTKYKYQSSSCTTPQGYPGLKCTSSSNGDCTSAFDCTISYSGG